MKRGEIMTWLSVFDGAAVAIVAKLAPWLAPLPTAWLVYDRTQQHLDWPWWVALIAGLTLEALGVAILATTLQLHSYNRGKRKSDPKAPLLLPGFLVFGYFVAAELLTVVLDIAPTWTAPLAAAVFPVLSMAAFAILALRADHEQRLTDIEQNKADARATRERNKRLRAKVEPIANEPRTDPEQTPSGSEPFTCSVCGRSFATQAALSGHGNAHNNGREPKRTKEAIER